MAKTRRPVPVITLDAHNDSIVLREVRGDPMDFAAADPAYQADLPRMRRGGIQAAFVMVGGKDLRQSSRLIDALYQMAERRPRRFALCRDAAQVRAAFRADRFALLPSIESQTMFENDLAHLRNWRRLGVRMATLTHGEGKYGGKPYALQKESSFFGVCTPRERQTLRRQCKGLTPFGRDVVDAMAELGMAVDLAHANDTVFWETLERAKGPVCYTHGACYAQYPHSRCLTDEMMKALAQRDGVMGICFCPYFIDDEDPSVERLADHFMHALEIMGPDHVGVGSDFDGIALHKEMVIPHAGRMPLLWQALARRGVPRADLQKIGHKNFLRMIP